MTREQRKRRRRLIAAIVASVAFAVSALVVSCNAYADGFSPREGGETWLAVAAAVAFGGGTVQIAAWLDK